MASDMTDEKINAVLKYVVRTFQAQSIKSESGISYAAIEASPLPAQLKIFLLDEIIRMAEADVAAVQNTRFVFADAKLQAERETFARALGKTATFGQNEFLTLIEAAAAQHLNYLFRPQLSLSEFIFGRTQERTTRELGARLSNFTDYRYLTDVFLQYLEKKQVDSITAPKFEKLIFDIDRKITLNYDKNDFLLLLKPIYDFFEEANESEVPVQLIIGFFQEKDLMVIANLFEDLRQKSVFSISIVEVNEIFQGRSEEVVRRKTGRKDAAAVPLQPAPAQPAISTPAVEPVATVSATKSPSKPVAPTTMQQAAAALPDETAPVPPVLEPLKLSNEIEQLPDETFDEYMMRQQESGLIIDDTNVSETPQPVNHEAELSVFSKVESPPAPPQKIEADESIKKLAVAEPPKPASAATGASGLPDLRVLISEEDRRKIIKRVFKGSEENYDRAVAMINDKKSWRDASLFIDDEVFLKYKVDEYSSEAVLFTDIVFSRYKNVG